MTVQDDRPQCLPTYLVIDTSYSMAPHEEILNAAVTKVFRLVLNSPRLAEFAAMSILTFNTEPHVVLAMADIALVRHLPRIKCAGNTDYGKLFRLLRKQIDSDVDDLLRNGLRRVLRPAMFLLTDGAPTDRSWRSAFGELADRDWHRRPHIVSFGFGKAERDVLATISTKAAFIATQMDSDSEAITEILGTLGRSLVEGERRQETVIPTQVDGFERIEPDYMS